MNVTKLCPFEVRANNSYSCWNVLQFSLYLSNYICNTSITSVKSKYATFSKLIFKVKYDKKAKGYNLVKLQSSITMLFTDGLIFIFLIFACYLTKWHASFFFPSLIYLEICTVSLLFYKYSRPFYICDILYFCLLY